MYATKGIALHHKRKEKSMEQDAKKTTEWEKPVLKKLSIKDAQANNGASNYDSNGYS